jgi:hypothetical protein
MENERNGGRMSVRRKFANMLEYFNPFSTMPPPPQEDEDTPAAKKPRLFEASIAADAEQDIFFDAHTTDTLTASPDDTVAVAPTVTVAVSLPSARAFRARPTPRKWKPEEDAKLVEAVHKLGDNWVAVATLVPGLTNIQCRKRWVDVLGPTIIQTTAHNKGRWTAQEDAKLTEAIKKHGNDWVLVAALVPGRTNKQCGQRWGECLDPAINTGKWTVGEDAMLTDAVTEHGGNNWAAVAALVPTRTNTMCRKRWVENWTPASTKVNGQWKKTQS